MTSTTEIKWKFMKLNGVLNRKYKVSNQGDIVLAKGMVPISQYNMGKRSPTNGSDYKSVNIQGLRRNIRVHRIVCETFHGKPPAGATDVNHIDEFKNNNSASNLAWATRSENMTAYYKNNKRVNFDTKTISTAKKLINKGWNNGRIGIKLGMSDTNVSLIKNGRIHEAVRPLTVEQLYR